MPASDSADPTGLPSLFAAWRELEGASAEPLGAGLIHRTWAVRAGGSDYVLQRVSPIFEPGIHENIAAVTARLAERGVATPMLVPTATGGLFAEQGGICWRLLTRVPGVTFSACRSPAQARSAGALVARFHSALADLDHEFRPIGIPLHDTAAHLAALESTLAEVGAHRLREQVEPLADEILAAALAWEDLGELPARVGHGDLKFDNLVFAGPEPPDCDRATHLIDLDTVAPRPLWTELGDAWRSWCNAAADESGARLDLALFRASCQGWGGMSELALDAAERGSLVFGLERIALELAARFTADALRESYFAWDSEHFPASGEHQLARARGQLELWRQALATRAEREALITAFVPVS